MGIYGTADAVFTSDSINAIISETESSGKAIIRGRMDGAVAVIDQNGESVLGISLRAPLSTDPSKVAIPEGSRILIIVDDLEQSLAVYRASDLEKADILLEERIRTQMAWRLRISSSEISSLSIMSATMPSKNRSAESSKIVPRGAHAS